MPKNSNNQEWYWGQREKNQPSNSYCYLMEMIVDSLDQSKQQRYKQFIHDNITELCVQVGNTSRFFDRLNEILMAPGSENLKIKKIMNLRNERHERFIDRSAAKLIYQAMTMKYIKQHLHRHTTGGGDKTKRGKPCYRRITKGRLGKTVQKCADAKDESTCGTKAAKGCDGGNCAVVDPDVPGYMRRVTDIKDKLFTRYQTPDGKKTTIIKGYCGDDKYMEGMGKALGERLGTNPACYRKITKGRTGLTVHKCQNAKDTKCSGKADGCSEIKGFKGAHCSASLDYSGTDQVYYPITDYKQQFFEQHREGDSKSTGIIQGQCFQAKPLQALNEQTVSSGQGPKCYVRLKKGRMSVSAKNCSGPNDTECNSSHKCLPEMSCHLPDRDYEKFNSVSYTQVKGNEKKLFQQYARLGERETPVLTGLCLNQSTVEPVNTAVSPDYQTCFRQVSRRRMRKPRIKRCESATECDTESPIQCRNQGKCVIMDPDNPGDYLELTGSRMKKFLQRHPEYNKQIIQGSCLTDSELNQSREQVATQLSSEAPPPISESQLSSASSVSDRDSSQTDIPYAQPYDSSESSGKTESEPSSWSGDSQSNYRPPMATPVNTLDSKTSQPGYRSSQGQPTAPPGADSSHSMMDTLHDIGDHSADMVDGMKDSFFMVKDGVSDMMDDLDIHTPGAEELIDRSKDMLHDLSSKLGERLSDFSDKAQEASEEAAERLQDSDDFDENTKDYLPFLPKMFLPALLYEFNIPLNINDVLLMSFSIFPYIGWIFDIFMIFRALLEKRWIYAILMIINWYQWFFWRIVSMGTISFDLGPLFKVIYLGTYASKYFNLPNVASTFIHFFSDITGNFPPAIEVSTVAGEAGEELQEQEFDIIKRGIDMTKQVGQRLQKAVVNTMSGFSNLDDRNARRGGHGPRLPRSRGNLTNY